MAVESYGLELVPGRAGHRAKSPKGLGHRAAGGGPRPVLRFVQRPEHDGPAGPDGGALFADAAEVLGLDAGDRAGGGPPGQPSVEACRQPPESQRPVRTATVTATTAVTAVTAVRDGVEELVRHRHQRQTLDKRHHGPGSRLGEVP
ncbi:hypothetical protein [Streptomyces sp. NPDC050535]|uniref:hypothetical protein n=1 Tax=Streptomyces sp. NPDC050535 TaxID=3365626 RepID=UPI0037A3BFAC